MTQQRRGIIWRDAELRTFIDGIIDQRSYGTVHDMCVKKFGVHRAPTTSTLSRYWIEINVRGKTRALWIFSRIVRDSEILRFIEEKKPGRSFGLVVSLCCDLFGNERTPSVATINRYWIRTHGRQRRQRRQKQTAH